MDHAIEQSILDARRALHALAELSGEETRTQRWIKEFLAAHTSLRIMDRGGWLYAKHDEGAARTLVLRADHDAVPTACGPRHLCGHDGHTAALLGLALLIEGRLGKNLILLFQPAEETGAGAADCCALFAAEGLTRENCRVFGWHNIPGEPLGELLFRRGTFACASCGVEIALTGRPTHAAYPENGRNPTAAISRLALELPAIAAELGERDGSMCLATVVGMRTGERAFGVAASAGRLWVTLRAEREAVFAALNARTDALVRELAAAEALEATVERLDVFPATENDAALQDALERACVQAGLPCRYLDVPFRWSEDFGHYGRFAPACFFGVGAGEGTPPLHTADYEFPDALAPIAAEALWRLLQAI